MMVVTGKRDGEATFICRPASAAKTVYVVGDFNRWNPTSKRMVKAQDGSFRATMSLPQGEHQYKFVIDGVWLNDIDAERQVTNPYGTLNSVMTVP